ncbi:MAG: cation-transporting P-type ATPase [Gammaproteobacteria bacterium]|nr:cation-transporting P-type ATPase [Gammaproteobacteria bacterium]
MRIHELAVDGALASLNSSADGLSAPEAARRLAEFGPNRLEDVARERLWLRLAREFTHFFAIILWLAAALAFTADWLQPGEGMGRLGVAILCVILINGLFSFWQEYKAERAVAALRRLLPLRVKALRAGAIVQLPASELVPGDVVLLEEGDSVPADCRVIEAFGLRVNTATVTGESLPKARSPEPNGEESLLFARNIVLAGTAVASGQARAVVYATGMHTEFGRIAHLTQVAGDTGSPLQREIARLSRIVAMLACGVGITFFVIGQALGLPFWQNFLFAIGIIVANVPEGLAPTVTLSLAMATQRMARRNALVRHLPAVETLGSTTVICCDKTGTLTQNRMAVRRLFLAGEECGADELPERPELQRLGQQLFSNAALCHDLKETAGAQGVELVGDPMEMALVACGRRFAGSLDAYRRLDEIPFDTDRKRMSVLLQSPRGRVLYCKGALERVLTVCDRVQTPEGVVALDEAGRARLLAAQDAMAGQGLRVLAFAHREVRNAGECPAEAGPTEAGMVLAGLVGLEDPPRAQVPAAIARCVEAGIRLIMITGDHPHTAVAIGREIGLLRTADPVVIGGDRLRRMSPAQLQLALDAPEILFARVAAEQKMLIVEALRKKGETVAVTGDGVNDAPALKVADIGIAMGIAGTDVAREAADIILLDDNFASIVDAIEEGRAVFDNIRKFLTYILSSNIPELVPYLAFVLFRIPLPLTIIQILAVDLGTDMLPALALGAEKPDPAVMRRPPRRRDEALLSWGLLARAYLFLGVLEAAAAMAVFWLVLDGAGWRYGEVLATTDPLYLVATTACLATIVVMQVMNLFLCRHPLKSILTTRFPPNRLIWAGIAAEVAVILAIVYTPAGNWLFGTAPLAGAVWLLMLPFALLMLGAEELRKAIARRRSVGPASAGQMSG